MDPENEKGRRPHFGSPVHFAAMASTMKSFMDQAFYVAGVNSGMLRHKVGASVVAVRRSGGLPAFNQLNNFIVYSSVMPASNYWNVIHGTRPGRRLKTRKARRSCAPWATIWPG